MRKVFFVVLLFFVDRFGLVFVCLFAVYARLTDPRAVWDLLSLPSFPVGTLGLYMLMLQVQLLGGFDVLVLV